MANTIQQKKKENKKRGATRNVFCSICVETVKENTAHTLQNNCYSVNTFFWQLVKRKTCSASHQLHKRRIYCDVVRLFLSHNAGEHGRFPFCETNAHWRGAAGFIIIK